MTNKEQYAKIRNDPEAMAVRREKNRHYDMTRREKQNFGKIAKYGVAFAESGDVADSAQRLAEYMQAHPKEWLRLSTEEVEHLRNGLYYSTMRVLTAKQSGKLLMQDDDDKKFFIWIPIGMTQEQSRQLFTKNNRRPYLFRGMRSGIQ